jgi:beta-galactosidase/beta-glucuronidase
VRAAIAIAERRARALRWSPEHPVVIDCVVDLRDERGTRLDRIRSYAALRTISTDAGQLLLNGEPYALRMALDQGYWPDGGLTAPDDAALARDVELARALGLNGVRKHQKAEDPRWLEQCDRAGLLVFGEMPSPRVFSERAKRLLVKEWAEIVERDRSHPCVIAWVPFNESWGVESLADDEGQRAHVAAVRDLTRELDPTRPVISNDGWEWVGGGIVGVHDYTSDPVVLRQRYSSASSVARTLAEERPEKRRLLLAPRRDEPVLLSEFGGLRLGTEAEGWGYADVAPADFARRVGELCAAARESALAGFCYTQLTDTYQERNGLVRMDRTPKAPLAELREAITGVAALRRRG